MSWSQNYPCYACDKQFTCPDIQKIRAAIDAIHSDPDHVDKGGGGYIVISCVKLKNSKN